jgi:hypothetical protein
VQRRFSFGSFLGKKKRMRSALTSFLCKKKGMKNFCATFLEKVAQKVAFRETLIPPGLWPPGWLSRSAQGQSLISLMRFDVPKLSFLISFGFAKRINRMATCR